MSNRLLQERHPRMKSDAKSELAGRAKTIIEKTYREKFSLQKISDELFVNRSYLSRIFTENYGISLVRYHNLVRCRHARELLQDPALKIEYIGETVGYASLSHFIKEFRRVYGVAPTQYRKIIKDETRKVKV